jgi:predicted N-acyltransferase
MNGAVAQLRIVQGVGQLPAAAWQELVAGRPSLRLEVLTAIEHTASRPLKLQFFLMEDGRGLAAAGICEVIASNATHNAVDALLFGRAAGAASKAGISTQPALVFETPLRRQTPVILRPDSTAQQRHVLATLLDAIEEYAAGHRLGIVFLGALAEDEALCDELRRRHYLVSETDSTATMEVAWADFDGYVEHLKGSSRKAAQNARTERNRNQRNGVAIKRVELTAADLNELYVLTRDHYRYKNDRDPYYGPGFLPLLADNLGEDLLVFEAVRAERRVAMVAIVRWGSVGWMAWVGIELDDRPNDFTYANLLFYEVANWAPAMGIKTLLYGTAAQQAKVKRGCRSIASYLFYRPHGMAQRLIARLFFKLHRAWYRRKNR